MAVQAKIRDNVTVNGSAGAVVVISATILSRYVCIDEDPLNGGNVGLVYQLPEENFLINHVIAPSEQLELGDKVALSGGKGPIVGMPAQTIRGEAVAATVLCKLISFTAAATKARISEVS